MSANTNQRRDRRYETPVFEVSVCDRSFHSINWSLTGLLLDGCWPDASSGERVQGVLRLPARAEVLEFEGSVVRVDRAGHAAIRLHNIGTEGVDFFDRALARRLR
jgi:hypothetical protein